MRFSVVFLAAAVAACTQAAPPPTAGPTIEPSPTQTLYTDAQKTALAAENIHVVYCAAPAPPGWCKAVVREAGKPVVVVENTSLFITTNLGEGAKAKATAAWMCMSMAAAPYDEGGELIGWLRVHVGSRTHEELAECAVA